jgi:hypothetical protein
VNPPPLMLNPRPRHGQQFLQKGRAPTSHHLGRVTPYLVYSLDIGGSHMKGTCSLRPIAPSQSDWYIVLFHQPNYRGNPTNRLSVTTIRCQIHSHRETWLIGRERGVGLKEDDPTLFWWTIKGRKVISISRRTRSLSSAARRLIAVAQKARWAKWTREQKPA